MFAGTYDRGFAIVAKTDLLSFFKNAPLELKKEREKEMAIRIKFQRPLRNFPLSTTWIVSMPQFFLCSERKIQKYPYRTAFILSKGLRGEI
jgi:hypothetical protein